MNPIWGPTLGPKHHTSIMDSHKPQTQRVPPHLKFLPTYSTALSDGVYKFINGAMFGSIWGLVTPFHAPGTIGAAQGTHFTIWVLFWPVSWIFVENIAKLWIHNDLFPPRNENRRFQSCTALLFLCFRIFKCADCGVLNGHLWMVFLGHGSHTKKIRCLEFRIRVWRNIFIL